LEEGSIIVGYADDILILTKADNIDMATARINLQISRVLRRITSLGLKIAEQKTGVIIFNRKICTENIYRIRVNREDIVAQKNIKYLGLILDEKWKFLDHFEYIEQKTSRVSQALFGFMPNLRGPKEKKRRLYGHVLNSIINYGAPIWSDATTNPKIKVKLMRIQRMMAIRIICGYRTISADAALLLARMPPTFLAAPYYKRVFLRVQELKRNDMWSTSDEKKIKKEEMILLRRQWEIYLQRENVAGVRTCSHPTSYGQMARQEIW